MPPAQVPPSPPVARTWLAMRARCVTHSWAAAGGRPTGIGIDWPIRQKRNERYRAVPGGALAVPVRRIAADWTAGGELQPRGRPGPADRDQAATLPPEGRQVTAAPRKRWFGTDWRKCTQSGGPTAMVRAFGRTPAGRLGARGTGWRQGWRRQARTAEPRGVESEGLALRPAAVRPAPPARVAAQARHCQHAPRRQAGPGRA